MIEKEADLTQSAWVVFSGQTDRPWLRLLKHGFRHCFILVNDGRAWFSFDPMLHYTDLRMHHHIPPNFDLPSWFADNNYQVMKTNICRTPKRPAPLAFFTCVEAVKRFLGIHARSVMTPWQLYRYLSKYQKNKGE